MTSMWRATAPAPSTSTQGNYRPGPVKPAGILARSTEPPNAPNEPQSAAHASSKPGKTRALTMNDADVNYAG
jgi:hypothetical protein